MLWRVDRRHPLGYCGHGFPMPTLQDGMNRGGSYEAMWYVCDGIGTAGAMSREEAA